MSDVYIIAEVGSSHCGSLGLAMQSATVFAKAGANAIKFQDHAGQPIPADAQHPPWFQGPRDIEERDGYLATSGFTTLEWERLAKHVKSIGIGATGPAVEYICSPFSLAAAKRQAPLVDRWKIASGQVTNLEMLRFIGETGKPVIASAGMATELEQVNAWKALGGRGPVGSRGAQLWWMTCSSLYPCPPEFALPMADAGDMMLEYPGLSDHTVGLAACLGAVALGATILEKHVCLTRHGYGTDVGPWAMEPEEFAQLVREVRALEVMLRGRDEAAYRERVAETRKAFMATSEREAAE